MVLAIIGVCAAGVAVALLAHTATAPKRIRRSSGHAEALKQRVPFGKFKWVRRTEYTYLPPGCEPVMGIVQFQVLEFDPETTISERTLVQEYLYLLGTRSRVREERILLMVLFLICTGLLAFRLVG